MKQFKQTRFTQLRTFVKQEHLLFKHLGSDVVFAVHDVSRSLTDSSPESGDSDCDRA